VSQTETVRAYYSHVDASKTDALVALFAPDVVYDRPGQAAIRGRAALRAFYEDDRPLSDGSHELDQVVADGRTVAVRGRFEGRQAGESVGFGFADFHEFDDEGLITRRTTFTDRDEV
jgi:ketosteroid isomerase-like protein